MIFYLEDDENIRNLTIYTLEQTGHETVGFSTAREMYEALLHDLPSMFILDVMLPDEDGFTVLQKLRAREDTANIPIMMLTAKGSEFDKVTGLDAGADDYMSKPYGMMELVSRINALYRRSAITEAAVLEAQAAHADSAAAGKDTAGGEASGAAGAAGASGAAGATGASGAAGAASGASDASGRASMQFKDDEELVLTFSEDEPRGQVFEAGPIVLDTSRYEVKVSGKPVQLTRKEFQMLAFLMANKGMVVTRSQLLDRVWGYRVAGQTRTVDAHMQTLRKKLSEADPAAYSQIETVRGVGYKMSD